MYLVDQIPRSGNYSHSPVSAQNIKLLPFLNLQYNKLLLRISWSCTLDLSSTNYQYQITVTRVPRQNLISDGSRPLWNRINLRFNDQICQSGLHRKKYVDFYRLTLTHSCPMSTFSLLVEDWPKLAAFIQIIMEYHSMHSSLIKWELITLELIRGIKNNQVTLRQILKQRYQKKQMSFYSEQDKKYNVQTLQSNLIPNPPQSLNATFQPFQQPQLTPQPDKKLSLSETITKYGTVGLVTHLTISWSILGVLYGVISKTGQGPKLIKFFKLENKIPAGAGTLAIASIIYKAIMPARIGLSLLVIPYVISLREGKGVEPEGERVENVRNA